ncbi:YceD family protein [Litoreibacter meonggei]|nr:YceD family protein [Litoreibacter meonggei]
MAKTTVLRLADLPTRKDTQISYTPDAEAMKRLATEMDVSAVRKMRLEGTLQPLGKKDWQLQARLGVTVVQPCVVTLEPVTTRIEEPVFRQYLSDWEAPTSAEAEMDGDDISEPLPDALDLAEIAAEALAMALPRYPRVEGATLDQTDFTEPGKAPLTDEDVKPFAGLASLKSKLENPKKN